MMGWKASWLECSLVLLVLALLMCRNSSVLAKKKKNDIIKKCETCRELVKKFAEGIERTERYNFAGGDVDWEEKKLGSYATSETRFIEITEQLCSSSAHEYEPKPDKGKKKKKSKEKIRQEELDEEFRFIKCHSMLEEHEEKLEEWWKEHQESDPDLAQWLCIDGIQVCCPENRFGPDCEECLGGIERPCRDNGKCSGGGTRGGTGKCKCNGGYKGWYCEVCKNGFYEVLKNDTHTICKACDDACASTCTAAGPKGCTKCKGGYVQDEEEGCKDIDECNKGTEEEETEEKYPCGVNQFCENTRGSYKCVDCDAACNRCLGAGNKMCVQCKDGYKLEEGACEDINECEKEDICQKDMACNNLPGTYYCDCQEGFTRMGEECVDKELLKNMKDNKFEIPDLEIGLKDNEDTDSNTEKFENKANLETEKDPQEPKTVNDLPSSHDVSTNQEETAQHTKEPIGVEASASDSFQSHHSVPAEDQGISEGATQSEQYVDINDSEANTESATVDKVNRSDQNDANSAAENVERTQEEGIDNHSQNQDIREEL